MRIVCATSSDNEPPQVDRSFDNEEPALETTALGIPSLPPKSQVSARQRYWLGKRCTIGRKRASLHGRWWVDGAPLHGRWWVQSCVLVLALGDAL